MVARVVITDEERLPLAGGRAWAEGPPMTVPGLVVQEEWVPLFLDKGRTNLVLNYLVFN